MEKHLIEFLRKHKWDFQNSRFGNIFSDCPAAGFDFEDYHKLMNILDSMGIDYENARLNAFVNKLKDIIDVIFSQKETAEVTVFELLKYLGTTNNFGYTLPEIVKILNEFASSLDVQFDGEYIYL